MSGVKTQGLKLQLGSVASPQTFSNVANIAGIQGLNSGSTSEIDITNFDSTAREFLRGFTDGGSVTINVNFDPDQATHQTLYDLYRTGETRQWRVLLSNASATYFEFDAYVSQFPFDFGLDDAVRSTVTLRLSGGTSLTV